MKIRPLTKKLLICLLSLFLSACASLSGKPPAGHPLPPATIAGLQQGKRFFDQGYYKRAMHFLLPLACDGIADAQYAVGYMYYYGLGVTQDNDVGYFWIERAASQHFYPAQEALQLIHSGKANDDKVTNGDKNLRMIQ